MAASKRESGRCRSKTLASDERSAARAVTEAHRNLAKARRALATVSHPGPSGAVHVGAWARARIALETTMRKRKPVGVVGWSIHVDHEGRVPCAVIYVRDDSVTVPKTIGRGSDRLPVRREVLGALKRHVIAGASVGPESNTLKGTIGCFGTAQGGRVAITAMHVTGLDSVGANACPMCVPSRLDGTGGVRLGFVGAGTLNGVDVARIDVIDGISCGNALPEIGPISGWRKVVVPSDHGTMVRMYGATTGFQSGHIVDPCAQLPEEQLEDAILVSIYSEEGDSGSALVDQSGLVLGFLVGHYTGGTGNLRAYSPAGPALHAIGSNIP